MLLIETEKFSAAAFMPQTPPEYSVWTVLPQGDGEALFALLPEPKPALICVSADWNRDLSPWFASKVFRSGEDFSGGADAFLQMTFINRICRADVNLLGKGGTALEILEGRDFQCDEPLGIIEEFFPRRSQFHLFMIADK